MFKTAIAWAERSTCQRGSAGCVIATPGGHILTTGFNGAPRGLPHCTEVGCLIEHGAPCPNCKGAGTIVRTEKYFVECWMCAGQGSWSHCVRAIHAEVNAVVQAARIGVSLEGAIVYVTKRPCLRCTMTLIQVGVHEIVYMAEYHSDNVSEVQRLLKLANVQLRKAETYA